MEALIYVAVVVVVIAVVVGIIKWAQGRGPKGE